MAKNQTSPGKSTNGKIHPRRIRLGTMSVNGAKQSDAAFVRSSHSLSTRLADRLRALAYDQRTSESSIIECALWLFFEKGSDINVLRLMRNAGIEPRRRRP